MFGERDDERGFTCSTQRQVSNADHGVIQMQCGKDARVVKLFSCLQKKTESAAHRRASIGWSDFRTRSVAPVFCSTMALAFRPSSEASAAFVRSFSTAGA